jgi:hypothetical protein
VGLVKLSQLDRLSVLACATGLAMLAIFFVSVWAGVPSPDWLPMVIAAIAGFEMYMVFDSARRRRA